MTTKLLLAAAIGLAVAAPAFASPAPPKIPSGGGWGFDLAGRDLAVKPGDDFYEYAVGDYLKTLRIPPDRSRWGSFSEVDERTQNQV
ncbi:MAG: peptidase M13, partial [Caulobacteraceae bacterium]